MQDNLSSFNRKRRSTSSSSSFCSSPLLNNSFICISSIRSLSFNIFSVFSLLILSLSSFSLMALSSSANDESNGTSAWMQSTTFSLFGWRFSLFEFWVTEMSIDCWGLGLGWLLGIAGVLVFLGWRGFRPLFGRWIWLSGKGDGGAVDAIFLIWFFSNLKWYRRTTATYKNLCCGFWMWHQIRFRLNNVMD